MEKIYEVVIDGKKTNEYIRGRISGMSYILTGMPEKVYGWGYRKDKDEWVWLFGATKELYQTVIDAIEKVYPGVIKYERINNENAGKEILVE